MEVKKIYRKSFSVRFDDGSLATTTFGTELAEEGADEAELFEQARSSTIADMKSAAKLDEMDKIILKKMTRNVKRHKKLEEAQKKLEDVE